MAIIDTLHEAQFVDEFQKINKENFSYDGLKTLFQYLDNLSEDCGENIEFDPIAFCCEFGEYDLEEFNNDYEEEYATIDELQEKEERVLARFTSRDFVNGEWIEEQKVLVHNG
tara:strand:- start:1429 stop:1767 length:339 start_codon:yes stop_codon:yes gene_type:complete